MGGKRTLTVAVALNFHALGLRIEPYHYYSTATSRDSGKIVRVGEPPPLTDGKVIEGVIRFIELPSDERPDYSAIIMRSVIAGIIFEPVCTIRESQSTFDCTDFIHVIRATRSGAAHQ
jgi:hypothetical protein